MRAKRTTCVRQNTLDWIGSSTSQTQSSQVQSNIFKTMVLVSEVFVIRWTPSLIFYLLTPDVKSDLTFLDAVYIYYVCVLLEFLYVCANQFIYLCAVKFSQVRRVLVRLIPWKKSQ